MNTVSSDAERSQPATGSDSSIGRARAKSPATPARAASAPAVSVFTGVLRFDRVHVLVAASGEADEDAAAGTELAGDHARLMQRVRRLERRHDALEPGAELERGHRVFVVDGDVVHALEVAHEGMLRTDAGIVTPGR